MTSLTSLAATISAESWKLTDYIVRNNLPNPSFDVGAPPELPIPIEDKELQESRLKLLRAAQDLAALALGPVEDLRWKAWNVSKSTSRVSVLLARYRPCGSITLSISPYQHKFASLKLPPLVFWKRARVQVEDLRANCQSNSNTTITLAFMR
jgi:hypothetical protein